MPSWELFDAQPDSYKDEVLPPQVENRIAVEAGVTQGWHRYVGQKGEVVGIDHFGASAPYKRLYKEFGLTAEKCRRKGHVNDFPILGLISPMGRYSLPIFLQNRLLKYKRRCRDFFPRSYLTKKIPQEVAVAADRALFHGAISAKVTSAKARGCGYFSVRNREDRGKSAGDGAVTA